LSSPTFAPEYIMPRHAPLLALVLLTTSLPAQDRSRTVEQLAEQARPSTAVLVYTGRDGRATGLGTGFVVAPGLIATNLHVIGEGRPISVQLADGSKHDAVAVHAWDRKLDLAIVRIARDDVLGHPRGLEYSVVSGVLSGKRDLDGVSMLQLAIPIEQGNSGGPVLDGEGNVLGIVTMKSLLTPTLGFAVPSDALQPLLKRPNSVPMDQWLTLGTLDRSEWKTLYGGRWRQRAGRILADGSGSGFGGRTLCYAERPAPELPFELTVTVKLDDEAGAAGLIFAGDGKDRHYGFYPSGGKLRLTRFDGPDVYSWKIVQNLPSPVYRPGDWNTLKVRLEKDKLLCYVNDQQLIELDHPDYAGTQLGLAKFRETIAEFKKFNLAPRLPPVAAGAEALAELEKTLARLPRELDRAGLKPLLERPDESAMLLRERARKLDEEASRLRQLAQTVHHERCLADIAQIFQRADAKVDLLRAALLLARLDNEDLDVDAYLREVDRLGRSVAARLGKDATPQARLEALNRFLFQERGFHGSRSEYYARANSYLNEVIDDREGLPITLSVLYIELARRVGLNVVGVALPGHFVVRHEPPGAPAQVIDVFDSGKLLSDKEVADKVRTLAERDVEAADLEAVSRKAIVRRMLENLFNAARREDDQHGMQRYSDAILVVEPDAHDKRWLRALLRFRSGQRTGAIADCDYLLEHAPAGPELERVRDLRNHLMR
jgi:serine protease Do